MKIEIDFDTLSSDALRRLAYALADTSCCRTRGERKAQNRNLRAAIAELANRANGGDLSELAELHYNNFRLIDRQRAGANR